MISIDETVDEPNWLRYTERITEFSRMIRFDVGGLGSPTRCRPAPSPPSSAGPRTPSRSLDAAGCERAVLLAANGGAMAAIVLAATRPERVASVVIINGRHLPCGRGLRLRRVRRGALGRGRHRRADGGGRRPQDIASSPRAWRTGSASPSGGRAAGRGASPATAAAFNLVTFSADVRHCLPILRARRWSSPARTPTPASTTTAAIWPSTSPGRAS